MMRLCGASAHYHSRYNNSLASSGSPDPRCFERIAGPRSFERIARSALLAKNGELAFPSAQE